jgi:hypothetical protein
MTVLLAGHLGQKTSMTAMRSSRAANGSRVSGGEVTTPASLAKRGRSELLGVIEKFLEQGLAIEQSEELAHFIHV